MKKREVLAALRSMAGEKPSFSLPELSARLGSRVTRGEFQRTIGPFLDTLGLRFEERGDDLLISRLQEARPFSLPRDGERTDAAFLGHPSIPPQLQELIESYISKKTGKNWHDPVVLGRIRAAIRAQKGEYWDQAKKRPPSYGSGYRILAYLAYQLPVSVIQFQHLLHDMAGDGLLRERMRVLDLGSGPGTVPLAITDAWNRFSPGAVSIFAVEMEAENLETYRFIVPAFASGNPAVHIADPIREDLRSLDPGDLPAEIDLMVFGNVLNELRELSPAQKAGLVEKCSGALAQGGTVVIMEPADLENSVSLRRLTAALMERGMTLYAPCTPLWSTACRPDRCWTFREGPQITPPRLMNLLSASDDGYRYRNTDIKFSYAILRKDGRTRVPYRVPGNVKALRLSKIQGHLERRVNVVVAKMSGDLGGGRGDHVFKVCDGTPQKPVFAVVPDHQKARARALLESRYGDILFMENVQVRSNPAHDAFNLFVDRSSRVSVAGAAGMPGKRRPRRGPRRSQKTG
jgi:SAM-dependent methyltransferase